MVSFSIITSILNTEKSKIIKCFNSIRNQSYKNFEYIVVDGGSSKDIQELYHTYKDVISKTIIEKDEGIYDAWNKGLKYANNEWICFIGADDELKSDALENYNNFILHKKNLQYVSSKINLIDKKGSSKIIGTVWNWKIFSHHMNVAHPGSMHSKELFKKNKFDKKYKIAGDYEFLLRFRNNLKAGYMDIITLNMSNDGISNSNFKVLKETLFAKMKHTDKNKHQLYIEYYISVLKWYIKKILY